jgi:membrane protein required for colicin V production
MDISLSGLDIVFLILIAFAALRAGIRGFVHEFLSMAAVLLGIATAVFFSGIVAQMLQPYIGGGAWSQVVAFLGLFLIVYVVVKLFETALNRIIERINLESLDRALGFFLGIAEGLFLVFVLVLLLQLQPIFDVEQMLLESQIARFLVPLLPYAERALDMGI